MSIEEKLLLAKTALRGVARKIKNEPKVAYHIGAGSQTFEDVTAALAALDEKDVHQLRDSLIPGSADLHRGGAR